MMKQGNLMYIQAKNTPKNISIKTSTRNCRKILSTETELFRYM